MCWQKMSSSYRFASGDDTYIGARPTPLLACGIYGLVRNTVDVAVMDVEVCAIQNLSI